MRPSKEVVDDCYQLVRDVAGKISEQGGIELSNKGQFMDFIHKIEGYLITKYKKDREL